MSEKFYKDRMMTAAPRGVRCPKCGKFVRSNAAAGQAALFANADLCRCPKKKIPGCES